MKQEVLERLMVDNALGGLSPDVDALLDAYLGTNPEQAEHAREIRDTVALAQRLVKPRCAVSLPPLKVHPLPTTRMSFAFPARAAWPMRLAAAFVIGLALGVALLHRPVPPRNQPAVIASATPNSTSTESTFWSAQRWVNGELTAPSPKRPRVSWTSPIQKPQLND